MCTVTYLPQPGNRFVLTQSRDEHVGRKKAEFPWVCAFGSTEVLYPIDGQAGGTWIGSSEQGRTVCLLNGAFERHTRAQSYRMSRGLILLDNFRYTRFKHFVAEVDLEHIEPFTMIAVEKWPELQVVELRWDGTTKHVSRMAPDEPYMWSSATLYDHTAQRERNQWFRAWRVQQPQADEAAIMRFHLHAGKHDPENGIRMQRNNGVQTVSITQVYDSGAALCMEYHDLRHQGVSGACLQLSPTA